MKNGIISGRGNVLIENRESALTSKTRQYIYAAIAILGVFATWYFNIQFMLQGENLSLGKFIADNYVNFASASISNDIGVVALTFLFWSFFEARKLKMRNWWLYVVLTFVVAMAFAFPLFMLMRERKLSC